MRATPSTESHRSSGSRLTLSARLGLANNPWAAELLDSDRSGGRAGGDGPRRCRCRPGCCRGGRTPGREDRACRRHCPGPGGRRLRDPRAWFTPNSRSKAIAVCWENPTEADADQRQMFRGAVRGSWERYSAVRFVGWDQCDERSDGVRIRIEDGMPHAKAVGYRVAGLKDVGGERVVRGVGRCLQAERGALHPVIRSPRVRSCARVPARAGPPGRAGRLPQPITAVGTGGAGSAHALRSKNRS